LQCMTTMPSSKPLVSSSLKLLSILTTFQNAVCLHDSSMSLSTTVPSMPSNMAFHNLTPDHIVPKAAKSVLGLGLKFMSLHLSSKTTDSIDFSFQRFEQDFNLKVFIVVETDEATLCLLARNVQVQVTLCHVPSRTSSPTMSN
jgi:hypothetical protein